jgi:hypothetical protein
MLQGSARTICPLSACSVVKTSSWRGWVPRVSLRVHSALYMKEDMHILVFLHFADQDKVSNMSEVLLRFNMCIGEYESLLHDYPNDLEQYMKVIKVRNGGCRKLNLCECRYLYFSYMQH